VHCSFSFSRRSYSGHWRFRRGPFISTNDTNGPLSAVRGHFFRFNGPFPFNVLTCGPRPNSDARGPIIFTRTFNGLLTTSASYADSFSTSGTFALRMDCFVYHMRTSARCVQTFSIAQAFPLMRAPTTSRYGPKSMWILSFESRFYTQRVGLYRQKLTDLDSMPQASSNQKK
jgi:hypothetical protein